METTFTERFTLKLAWQMAAPHTWPAALVPGLVAIALSVSLQRMVSMPLAIVLLLICILMQSSANMINDYLDFVKGTDSKEDVLEEDDAVLLYHAVDPKAALFCGIGLLAVAFLLGIYPILVAGWVPLLFAVVGAAVVVLYSCGKTPLSYLPIGELVIGVVMGGLMPLACCYVLTGTFSIAFAVGVLPCVIGVALILLTNNTCDIEKDRNAGRRTLAALIGRPQARTLYHGLVALWLVLVPVVISLWFAGSLFLLPFMFLALLPMLQALLRNPLDSGSRIAAMSQVCTMNVLVGAFYIASIFAGSGGLRFII